MMREVLTRIPEYVVDRRYPVLQGQPRAGRRGHHAGTFPPGYPVGAYAAVLRLRGAAFGALRRRRSGRGVESHEAVQVAAHDLLDGVLWQSLQVVHEGDGVGHALGVRIVDGRARVGTEEVDETLGILLVEGDARRYSG